MLNEFQEFQQYVMPMEFLTEPSTRRLKYATLSKGPLSGLERAMTTIARWFIFKDNDTINNFDEDSVKEALKAWCGFEHNSNIAGIELLNGWFNRYIRQLFLKEALEDCNAKLNSVLGAISTNNILTDILKNISADDTIMALTESKKLLEDAEKEIKQTVTEKIIKNDLAKIKHVISILNALENKSRQFNKSVYSSNCMVKNDYKAITYERIIANAFHFGKLEQFYLLCDTYPFELELIRKQTKTKTKIKDSDQDLILKATALYLLQKQYSDQEYVYFNQADLANWLLKKADPDKFELNKYWLIAPDEPLFDTITINGNITKLKIHPKWTEKFKIVRSCDIDKPENQGRIFYSDPGCSDFLQCNEKYKEL